MIISISLAAALIFTAVCGGSLWKKPAPYYAAALLTAAAVSAISISGLRLPAFANEWIMPFFAKGGLAGAMFILVMYAGAMPTASKAQRLLMPVRGQLSIIASILALAHAVYSGRPYLLILLNKMRSFSSGQLAVFVFSLLMIAVMIPLFVTSFKKIRRKMKGRDWKKLQRLAYVFYALIYLHILLLMLPRALRGDSSKAADVMIYSLIFAGYFVLRVNKAVKARGKRNPLPAAAAICVLALVFGTCAGILPAWSSGRDKSDAREDVSAAALSGEADVMATETKETAPAGEETAASGGEAKEPASKEGDASGPAAAAGPKASAAADKASEAAEPPAEEQKAPEPPAEEQKAPEPPAEEQKVPEPHAEEQKAPEPHAEEQKAPEPPAEEQKPPEPPAEEQKAPEPPTEEQKAPDPPAEELKAPEPVRIYKDGTFKGSAIGNEGSISVSVTIKDDVIKEIKITGFDDDLDYFDPKTDGAAMISKMISAQSADVDVVSGATYSSYGLRDAVKKALAAAKN